MVLVTNSRSSGKKIQRSGNVARVLIIEDDEDVASMVADYLEGDHQIVLLNDGRKALEQMRNGSYDVIVLDWQLPGMSGVEICRQYRAGGGNAPVIMLTGKSELEDKTCGFESGADDYLTKPFALKELQLRIGALANRARATKSSKLQIHDLELDPTTATVTQCGTVLSLYRSDFALLEFLMRHPGQVFSAEALIAKVFQSSQEYSAESIRSSIKRIRQAIDTPEAQSLITTVHRIGYKLRT